MNDVMRSGASFARIRPVRLRLRRTAPLALSLVLCLVAFTLMSCSSGKQAQGDAQQAAPPPKAVPQKSGPQPQQNEKLANLGITPTRPYAEKAIQIQYRADENLNTYQDKPHTLFLVVYQVGDVNPFNNLTKDAAGLTTLLKAEKFDQGVLAIDKFFIEPGQTGEIALDRYENVKWVGIVAGYYDLTPGQVTRAWELPVQVETKGMIFKTNTARMKALGMNLFFGPSSIQEVPSP